jgi:hypothetical protein
VGRGTAPSSAQQAKDVVCHLVSHNTFITVCAGVDSAWLGCVLLGRGLGGWQGRVGEGEDCPQTCKQSNQRGWLCANPDYLVCTEFTSVIALRVLLALCFRVQFL